MNSSFNKSEWLADVLGSGIIKSNKEFMILDID